MCIKSKGLILLGKKKLSTLEQLAVLIFNTISGFSGFFNSSAPADWICLGLLASLTGSGSPALFFSCLLSNSLTFCEHFRFRNSGRGCGPACGLHTKPAASPDLYTTVARGVQAGGDRDSRSLIRR